MIKFLLKFLNLNPERFILTVATFQWGEANGAGETDTLDVTNINWKNEDSVTDNYASFPITAGNNSFEKWNYGKFSGSFNTILAGLFAHTAVAFGAGLTLKGQPAMTGDGDKLAYATPSASANANLTVDMTSVIAIGSGVAVWFGETSPTGTKTASETTNPCWTNFLTTQLQTTSGAGAGDTANVTITLQYDEN